MDTYKQENGSTTAHLIGQDWQKLIDLMEGRPDDTEMESFDGEESQFRYRSEDDILKMLQDVKRLRQKDMPLFGRCPETDNFYTVVCSSCSMILMPHALKDHWEKRHGDSSCYSPSEKQSTDPSGKVKSKKVTPVKGEKIEKPKKTKSNALMETTGEIYKDPKRFEKPKKGKSAESKPVDLENSTGKSLDKGKPKGSRFTSDLQPIVALSPIQVGENVNEGANENCRELKTRKKDKKKNDRKADKLYDPDKHCGVINDTGKPCVRSILCKVHQVALKRAVDNRTMPYDVLIRILKSQNDDDKAKAENGSLRLPKMEAGEKILSDAMDRVETTLTGLRPSAGWPDDQISIKTEEPPTKRLKVKDEIADDDVDQSQFTLPSHLEALIDETLKTLKDVDENESLPIISVIPKAEPILKWSSEAEAPQKSLSPPPQVVLDDIHWHSSHPKPLATNTFGCRLIGGLMSTCKKLDTLRKHLQSVWASTASPPPPIRSGFNEAYNPNNPQTANAANGNPKASLVFSKHVKKSNQNKGAGGASPKKSLDPTLNKSSAVKRKRKFNPNVITPIQNTTSTASEIISGLVINPVPVQRTGSSAVPTIPTGVIPVNSITGNGVPLRLFQGSLPVIASATHNQPATFIQLNLCPPK